VWKISRLFHEYHDISMRVAKGIPIESLPSNIASLLFIPKVVNIGTPRGTCFIFTYQNVSTYFRDMLEIRALKPAIILIRLPNLPQVNLSQFSSISGFGAPTYCSGSGFGMNIVLFSSKEGLRGTSLSGLLFRFERTLLTSIRSRT
jgi:hypothetical protein